MRRRIPAIHAVQHARRLSKHQHRTFLYYVKLRPCDDHCNLQHAISIRVQTRHFHVDPDQVEIGEARVL